MATGNSDETRPLLGRQSARECATSRQAEEGATSRQAREGATSRQAREGATARHAISQAREGLEQRGSGVQRLSNTAERLRDALRLQAELAKALREKEEKKAKSSKFSLFKHKKVKKPKREKSYSVGDGPGVDTDLGIESSGHHMDTSSGGAGDSHSVSSGVSSHSNGDAPDLAHDDDDDVIQRVYRGEIVSDEQLVREAVARGVDMDNLVDEMFQRADELETAANVAFEKNPPVGVLPARRRKRLTRAIGIGVGVVAAVAIIITIIVVVVLHPWRK